MEGVTEPESEPESDPEPAAEPEPAAQPVVAGPVVAGRTTPRRSRRETILGLVALAGLTGTLAFGLAWNHARSHDAGVSQAKATARNFLTALTNFDGKSIDADFDRIISYATGTFAQQADQFYADKDTRNALRVRQASSRGEIKDLFVQSSVNGRVRVYGVIDETIANNTSPAPQADELRIEVGLVKVKGNWRVYDVRVLQAPSDAGTGTPTTPTTAAS